MQDNKLSLEAMLQEAAGGEPAVAEVETEPTTSDEDKPKEDVVEEQPQADETKVETKPETKPETEESKSKTNPVKELRDKYSSEKTQRELVENTIERFTNGNYDFNIRDFMIDGKMDYPALINAMNEADTAAKAQSSGRSPEVQAELERIEQENLRIRQQRMKLEMDRALVNMQLDMNLKQGDINNFFKDAMALQKNPYKWLEQGGTLPDLYNLIYHDRILQKAIDDAVSDAKASWEEEHARVSKTPTPNPGDKKTRQGASGGGVSLEAILAEALKK